MQSTECTWTEIAKVDDIPRLGARVVRLADRTMALFRLANDQFRLTDNTCPHKGGPLAEGIVAGEFVFCPLHDWKVCLADGQAQSPDSGCTGVHSVEVREGIVYLAVAAEPSPFQEEVTLLDR